MLRRTPPLPDECYDAVSREIARERRHRRLSYAVAAVLVLAVALAVGTIGRPHAPRASAETTAVVEEELSAIQDYFSDESINNELASYALFTPSLFTSPGGSYEQNP